MATKMIGTKIPLPMLIETRERYPETRDMSDGRLLRFALALALGKTRHDAVTATRDARIGVRRQRQTTA